MGRPLKVEQFKDVEKINIYRSYDGHTKVMVTHHTDGREREVIFTIDERQVMCINEAIRRYLRERRHRLVDLINSTEEKV